MAPFLPGPKIQFKYNLGVDILLDLWYYNYRKKKGENKMDEMKAINDYLMRVIRNNSYCQVCELNHDGICFFAYECIAEDFNCFLEKDA